MLKKVLMAGVIVVAASSFALAHPHRGPQRADGARCVGMQEALGLSDEQKAKLDQLRDRQQSVMKARREELKAKAVEFRDLSDANDPRADAAREQMRELREEMVARRIAHRADVMKILTPEQQKKFEELRPGGGRRFDD